jgi:cell wall-associated NlpC family hydrolase
MIDFNISITSFPYVSGNNDSHFQSYGKHVLGPILACVLIFVFFGINLVQAAPVQMKPHILRDKKTVSHKTGTIHQTIKKHPIHKTDETTRIDKAHKTSDKRSGSAKKTMGKIHAAAIDRGRRNHHRTHRILANIHRNVQPMPNDDVLLSRQSDFLAAKESLERARLMNDGDLDEQTIGILQSAYSCIGTPYQWGGTTPDGFDCSGFVKYVYNENGILLRRSSHEQVLEGKPVPITELKPGDLIFFKMSRRFRDRSRVNHVGMYVGNGQFIHATSNPYAHEIRVDELDSGRYLSRIVEARRVVGE